MQIKDVYISGEKNIVLKTSLNFLKIFLLLCKKYGFDYFAFLSGKNNILYLILRIFHKYFSSEDLLYLLRVDQFHVS